MIYEILVNGVWVGFVTRYSKSDPWSVYRGNELIGTAATLGDVHAFFEVQQ